MKQVLASVLLLAASPVFGEKADKDKPSANGGKKKKSGAKKKSRAKAKA